MTNLTEQWNKGELPNGWYYVRLIRGEHRIDLYINGKNEWIDCPDVIIDTIVCKVPSYEEYTSLVNWKEDLTELCTVKERIIEKYENIDTWWKATNAELKEENTKLKELLKEANDLLKALYAYEQSDFVWVQVKQCLSKINQVLGQDDEKSA